MKREAKNARKITQPLFEAQALAKEKREFDSVFAGGRSSDPDAKTIRRIVSHQKSRRAARQ